MKANNRIYTIIYTVVILFVGLLSLFDYIFVPSLPFLYLLILPLFIFQCHIFLQYCNERFNQWMYLINLVSMVLYIKTGPLVFTQYFAIFHCSVLIFSIIKYKNDWVLLGGILLLRIMYFIGIAQASMESALKLVLIHMLSAFMSLVFIFFPFPMISLQDQYTGNETIKFGSPHEAGEVFYNDFFSVRNIINIGIGKFVQLGEFVTES